MGFCKICGRESSIISNTINVCVDCLRNKWILAREIVRETHINSRLSIGLTPETPRNSSGLKCSCCGRECLISKSETGYCSIRINYNDSINYTTFREDTGIGLYYYDPHPTNCVAFPVCPAITGRGYPKYALTPNGESGYYNIAVFMAGCNMNCLYCQNWEFREMSIRKKPLLTISDLVRSVNYRTTCVCFFGGDPGPWSTFVLEASRKIMKRAEELKLSVFRICWETNGLWNPYLFKKAVEYSLETGGIVKIDFKAWSPEVYYALTGIEPQHIDIIKKNIVYVAELFNERPEPPLLVISTLVVPHYIDEYEIDNMTKFIASINPEIPYVFLAFHPDYKLFDLPRTSYRHMNRVLEIARKNGLKNIYVGNKWLLGNYY
ncbi:MAG: radical SAM protein [Desulfurococcaceae archaeon]